MVSPHRSAPVRPFPDGRQWLILIREVAVAGLASRRPSVVGSGGADGGQSRNRDVPSPVKHLCLGPAFCGAKAIVPTGVLTLMRSDELSPKRFATLLSTLAAIPLM